MYLKNCWHTFILENLIKWMIWLVIAADKYRIEDLKIICKQKLVALISEENA